MRKAFWGLLIICLSSIVKAETLTYSCNFTIEATSKGLKNETFGFSYVVDSETQKAYLVGNAGSSEVQEIANESGVSFLEITGSGNVMVTAITESGDAVHSRNGIMSGKLIPSQHYGKCQFQ